MTLPMEPQGDPIHQLVVEKSFNRLTEREKRYAHHLSRAAWYGTRVILRQTSPESNDIFDLIMTLHKSCNGSWTDWIADGTVTQPELSAFLDYAATFLNNIGNYYADGGRKIVPALPARALGNLATRSGWPESQIKDLVDRMLSTTQSSFGYPSETSQANYYPGQNHITRQEIALVSRAMEMHHIEPENTRISKRQDGSKLVFEVLQASTNSQCLSEWDQFESSDVIIRIIGGDHLEEMTKICDSLEQAKSYVSNENQTSIIDQYIVSFRTGSLQAYRESQKVWVKDQSPTIETIFGFVEPYRDPHSIRGEWQSIVFISDPVESLRLKQLVQKSDDFIRLMPWAVPDVNGGKGPFEKKLFEAPDFVSVHALTSCSSIIWHGINLPNYNDIRETCGFKNLVIANRLSAENDTVSPCYYVHSSEMSRYKECVPIICSITVAVHELIGHGSGKLLAETNPGEFNFDRESPPLNPLTGSPVQSWYLHGQTWTGVFGEISDEVEECRAELMSMFLMDNKEILSIFGHDDTTSITPAELLYFTYIHMGVQGLQALRSYNMDEQIWGDSHRSGQFAILKHLIIEGRGVLAVNFDPASNSLVVVVDRAKITSCGQPTLASLLCKLQIWRCTADAQPCIEFYKKLSAVDGEYEHWRQAVCSNPEPRWRFVQPNTLLESDRVCLKVYDESNEGIIQSWAERDV